MIFYLWYYFNKVSNALSSINNANKIDDHLVQIATKHNFLTRNLYKIITIHIFPTKKKPDMKLRKRHHDKCFWSRFSSYSMAFFSHVNKYSNWLKTVVRWCFTFPENTIVLSDFTIHTFLFIFLTFTLLWFAYFCCRSLH